LLCLGYVCPQRLEVEVPEREVKLALASTEDKRGLARAVLRRWLPLAPAVRWQRTRARIPKSYIIAHLLCYKWARV